MTRSKLVKQFPTLFFFLNQPPHFGGALIEVLNKYKSAGKLNNKVVLLSVGDQFGAEFAAGFGAGLKATGYDIVLQKSYPLGAADLTNEIKEAKASGADTFIAGSYPPDTFMLTGTAITQGYNPKIYYTAVGTAFAEYGANFKDKVQGVLGIGGWDPNLPGAQDYYKRQQVAVTGHAPDGWASPVTYASLQILEQAIEKAGTLDRKKVLETIANGGPWNTVVGPIDLKTHIRENQWGAGQWQNGPVRRRFAERHGGRAAGHLPQAGVVNAVGVAAASKALPRLRGTRSMAAKGRSGLSGPALLANGRR